MFLSLLYVVLKVWILPSFDVKVRLQNSGIDNAKWEIKIRTE